jgi:hypothetical protein
MPVIKYCLEFQTANDVLKEKIRSLFLSIISVSPTRPNISCYSEFYKWPKSESLTFTPLSLPNKYLANQQKNANKQITKIRLKTDLRPSP